MRPGRRTWPTARGTTLRPAWQPWPSERKRLPSRPEPGTLPGPGARPAREALPAREAQPVSWSRPGPARRWRRRLWAGLRPTSRGGSAARRSGPARTGPSDRSAGWHLVARPRRAPWPAPAVLPATSSGSVVAAHAWLRAPGPASSARVSAEARRSGQARSCGPRRLARPRRCRATKAAWPPRAAVEPPRRPRRGASRTTDRTAVRARPGCHNPGRRPRSRSSISSNPEERRISPGAETTYRVPPLTSTGPPPRWSSRTARLQATPRHAATIPDRVNPAAQTTTSRATTARPASGSGSSSRTR
jgi:hypothetical protein